MKYINIKNLFWILPSSLALGAMLSSLQPGSWLIGWLGFSFLFLLSFSAFSLALEWSGVWKTLAWIVALAFALRFAGGVATYFALPVNGYQDKDDKAGYVFTDAHRRDDQAWTLASSERPILDAFSRKFAYDQYGGLLAFSAFVYRYLSPDAHRPLMLVLLSAFIAALGIPFLWKAARQVFGEKVAWVAAWIFALYPESILLGGSAMREPYLMTFSAFALWGFVDWRALGLDTMEGSHLSDKQYRKWIWPGIGLLGMLLVSPPVALFTIIIFAGWVFFAGERGNISWKVILIIAFVFTIGLFILSSSLNRSGEFNATSPLHVINDWFKLAVKWDAYQLVRESGWVQKLFDEMPVWMRLPFVTIYGVLRPVLPATLIDPTTTTWKVIYILRGLGWYELLPMLVLSFMAGPGPGLEKKRSLWMWLSFLAWTWILLASLRGGGDDWDNPRYRAIMFMWQALIAGYVWVWWRETRNAWFGRVFACEAAFLMVFTQWYASRYFQWGAQLPFAWMVALIMGLWIVILGTGWWLDKRRA